VRRHSSEQVARCDTPEVLEPTVAALDDVAGLVGLLVVTNALLAIRPAWDHRSDAVLSQGLAERVAVISFVAEQLRDTVEQRPDGAVSGVARGENQDPRAAQLIDKAVNLGVAAAPWGAELAWVRR
jgi:hypothetical protein